MLCQVKNTVLFMARRKLHISQQHQEVFRRMVGLVPSLQHPRQPTGAIHFPSLATFLEITRPAIQSGLMADHVPEPWLDKVATETGCRREYLRTGALPMFPDARLISTLPMPVQHLLSVVELLPPADIMTIEGLAAFLARADLLGMAGISW
jgi:hypothetical protein